MASTKKGVTAIFVLGLAVLITLAFNNTTSESAMPQAVDEVKNDDVASIPTSSGGFVDKEINWTAWGYSNASIFSDVPPGAQNIEHSISQVNLITSNDTFGGLTVDSWDFEINYTMSFPANISALKSLNGSIPINWQTTSTWNGSISIFAGDSNLSFIEATVANINTTFEYRFTDLTFGERDNLTIVAFCLEDGQIPFDRNFEWGVNGSEGAHVGSYVVEHTAQAVGLSVTENPSNCTLANVNTTIPVEFDVDVRSTYQLYDDVFPVLNDPSPAENSILKSGTNISIGATDENLDKIEFKWDNGSWTEDSKATLPSSDGQHVLYVRAVDLGGNSIQQSYTYVTDDTMPSISVVPANQSIIALESNISVSLTESHLDKAFFNWDGVDPIELSSPYLGAPNIAGSHNLTISCIDLAGNNRTAIFNFILSEYAGLNMTYDITSDNEAVKSSPIGAGDEDVALKFTSGTDYTLTGDVYIYKPVEEDYTNIQPLAAVTGDGPKINESTDVPYLSRSFSGELIITWDDVKDLDEGIYTIVVQVVYPDGHLGEAEAILVIHDNSSRYVIFLISLLISTISVALIMAAVNYYGKQKTKKTVNWWACIGASVVAGGISLGVTYGFEQLLFKVFRETMDDYSIIIVQILSILLAVVILEALLKDAYPLPDDWQSSLGLIANGIIYGALVFTLFQIKTEAPHLEETGRNLIWGYLVLSIIIILLGLLVKKTREDYETWFLTEQDKALKWWVPTIYIALIVLTFAIYNAAF